MKVGDIEVIPVPDGEARLPSTYFPNADWGPHAELLDDDDNFEIPIGCFLVRTGDLTVLVDGGLGPVEGSVPAGGDRQMHFRCGDLPAKLDAAGTKPEDVDLIVLTHLHLDHIGWVAQNAEPYFPNATVRFGVEDLDQFIDVETPDPFAKAMVDALGDRAEPITADGEVAPGISTLHSPGHTLGHRCVVVSSADERAFLLGDAVTCPIQLTESDWEAMSDVDPKLAKRSREALWRELEGSEDLAVAAHFPGLGFGRVLRGEGKRYFG